MSAIFGRLSLNDEPIDCVAFDATALGLRIWGPDRFDCVQFPTCSFAQATLLIAPHSTHERIATTASGEIVCADAIIDNRPELAIDLNVSHSELDLLSDTALIALAWDKWGQDCVPHLIGDFAFSVTNVTQKSVFLARDHIGSRPLYWARRGYSLIWSTSAQLIVDHQEWLWPIDEKAVIAFQAARNRPLSSTFFQDLQKLEPASQIEINAQGTSARRWWQPVTRPVLKLDSQESYTQACRKLVERAVQDRSHTAFPIGAHLSGGIDSTGVAVLAARHLKARSRTLCGGYAWSPPVSETYSDMGPKDERRRITLVADKEGIPVRFGTSTGANVFEFFTRPLEVEGIADVADEFPILLTAADDGARVLLSGWGGDEGFSTHGHGYVGHLLLNLKLSKAANFIRRQTRSLRNIGPVLNELWWNGFHPMLPDFLYHAFDQFQDPDHSLSFMRKEVAEANQDFIKNRQRELKFYANPALNIKIYLDFGHIGMRMETWAAWSAPHRLQYRYPLTDRRLLEFLMSIPPEALFPNECSRGLAMAVLADVIPHDVTKHDVANEALRQQAREQSWQIAAARTQEGLLAADCPWFDMPRLRDAALNPADQSTGYGVLRFAELMTALRLWFLWLRSKKHTLISPEDGSNSLDLLGKL
jgi:asparagine synthase (glutamine-hydrolysing)